MALKPGKVGSQPTAKRPDRTRQGYVLQLTRYDEKGWRATFYTTGMEHSPTSATGTGWERTPWRAGGARRLRR